MSKSTITNLQTPKIGRPLPFSWCKAVTDNLNREELTPGAFTDGAACIHSAPAPYVNPLMLRVKNMTEVQLPMFSVLRVTEPWITDNAAFPQLLRMQQNELLGYTPDGSCHEKIAITSYISLPGIVVPSVIDGPSPVKIKYPDKASLEYPFARSIPGDCTQLLASPYGYIKILWHAEPEEEQDGCDPRTLWSWVNMGENGEWAYFVLQEDLTECGSAVGIISDECGNQIGDCPVYRDIYGPKSYGVCGCENNQTIWKAGDVVPAMWYQYLCRWITFPNPAAGLETREGKFLSNCDASKLKVNLESEEVELINGLTVNNAAIAIEETDVPTPIEVEADIEINGSASFPTEVSVTGEAALSGPMTGTISGNTTAGIDLSGPATFNAEFSAEAEFESEKQTVVTGVEYTPQSLVTEPVEIPVATGVSINAKLDENSTETIEKEFTASGTFPEDFVKSHSFKVPSLPENIVSGVSFNPDVLKYQKATGISADGLTVAVKVPVVGEVKVVSDIEVADCKIKCTYADVQVITGWTTETYSLSGSLTPKYEETSVSSDSGSNPLNVASYAPNWTGHEILGINPLCGGIINVNGKIEIPSNVSGSGSLQYGSPMELNLPTSLAEGGVSPQTSEISMPTGKITITPGEEGLTGFFDLSGGSCSLTGLLLSADQTRVELKGPVELTGQNEISKGTVVIDGGTAAITGSVNIPRVTGLTISDAVELKTVRIPKIISASISDDEEDSAFTSTTLNYITCKCESGGENETESESGGENETESESGGENETESGGGGE